MVRDLEPAIDAAKTSLGAFVGACPEDLAFVPNATTGVNAVLGSYPFEPGDELLTTNQDYNACRNALEHAAQRCGAKVVVAAVPFPIREPDQVVQAVLDQVTESTRVALIDHVTSPTGLVLPVARLVEGLRERGVEVLIDGAHAPGMVDLDIEAIGAGYYTGNCHKWICAPKGAAFLHVRRDLQDQVRPVTISHGANSTRVDRSRFRLEFDWVGTTDPTAYLAVPEALAFMGSLLEGGWPELRRHNHELALHGRDLLCRSLQISVPAPDAMCGSMAAVPLPPGTGEPAPAPGIDDVLQDVLLEQCRIEVPIVSWPARPQRVIRISAQIYNHEDQYQRLAAALPDLLEQERP